MDSEVLISQVRKELEEKKAEVGKLQDSLSRMSDRYNKTQKELKTTKRILQTEQLRHKQSSESLKRHNKDLREKIKELSEKLEREREIGNKTKNELDVLRNQQKDEMNSMQKLEEILEKTKEEIVDLESVLEAHQWEIEKQKNKLKTIGDGPAKDNEAKPTNKKKCKIGEAVNIIYMMKLFIRAKKISDYITYHPNLAGNGINRSKFDEKVCKLKSDNNALLDSIVVVKLTTRCFEAAEKELINLREENDRKITQALDTITKINSLYDRFMENYFESIKSSTKEYAKELEQSANLNLNQLYKNEEALQEEIIKKFQNERELLNTISSKQKVFYT